MVAIIAGLVAEALVDRIPVVNKPSYTLGGVCAPFELAALLLASGSVTARCIWTENHGTGRIKDRMVKEETTTNVTVQTEQEKKGGAAGKNRLLVLLLGVVVCLFEASMFLFVTAWTPALEHADCAGSCSSSGQTGPPLGLIFSSFMAACMFGSQLFGTLRDSGLRVRTEVLLATTCALGALCLAAAATIVKAEAGAGARGSGAEAEGGAPGAPGTGGAAGWAGVGRARSTGSTRAAGAGGPSRNRAVCAPDPKIMDF
jgi:hypothetical protein